jgi:hypothetical protein
MLTRGTSFVLFSFSHVGVSVHRFIVETDISEQVYYDEFNAQRFGLPVCGVACPWHAGMNGSNREQVSLSDRLMDAIESKLRTSLRDIPSLSDPPFASDRDPHALALIAALKAVGFPHKFHGNRRIDHTLAWCKQLLVCINCR